MTSDQIRGSVGACVAVGLLTLVSLTALAPVFPGPRYLVVGAAGTLAGAAVALAGVRWRLPAVAVVAGVAAAYAILAPASAFSDLAAARVLPNPPSLHAAAATLVSGWADVLTLDTPVQERSGLIVLPLALGLLTGTLGLTLALRTRWPATALLAPVATLCIAILLGVRDSSGAAVRGAVFAVIAFSWCSWQGRHRDLLTTAGTPRRREVQRTALAAATMITAGTMGLVAAPHVPGADQPDRVVLRDHRQPPFDARELRSPLAGFRAYVKEDKNTPLFRVRGMPDGGRLRIAALQNYDGVTWGVDPQSQDFRRPPAVMNEGGPGKDVHVDVQVLQYQGVWLPDAGSTESIVFGGSRAAQLTDLLRYDRLTDTGVVPNGLRNGDSYALDAILPDSNPPRPSGGWAPSSVALPDPQHVPDALASRAADYTSDSGDAYAKARAAAAALRNTGYFSHGLENHSRSRAGHGADRMAQMFSGDAMIGDAEQYASAMALMMRKIGLPARVVMGFAVPGSRDGVATVTGADVTAWVQVGFRGVGWVDFDPTPDPARVPPPPQAPKPKPTVLPRVQQPPPPLPPVDGNVDVLQTGDQPKPGQPDRRGHHALPVAALAVGGGAPLVLLGPAALLLALKAGRRQRRRRRGTPARRIAAGWTEVLDTAYDLGATLPERATRQELAAVLPAQGAAALAVDADRHIFSPREPSEEDVERFWREVESLRTGLHAGISLPRRWRARLSTRSLRRR